VSNSCNLFNLFIIFDKNKLKSWLLSYFNSFNSFINFGFQCIVTIHKTSSNIFQIIYIDSSSKPIFLSNSLIIHLTFFLFNCIFGYLFFIKLVIDSSYLNYSFFKFRFRFLDLTCFFQYVSQSYL